MIYLRLYYEFFKTGLFAIGGGLATLPFLRDIAVKTGWFTETLLADMIAISESTPGPIGVNMATYAGYLTGNIPGAIIATLGLVTPPFLIMLVIARMLDSFRNNHYVNAAFYGLRPAVVGLIGAAGFSVVKTSLLNLPYAGNFLALFHWPSLCIFAVVFLCMRKWKVHPIIYLVLSAVVGIFLGFI